MNFLNFLPPWLVMGGFLGLAGIAGWQSWSVADLRDDLYVARQELLLASQNLTACEHERDIIDEVSTEYYTRLDDLTRQRAAERLRAAGAARCVPVTKPAAGGDAASAGLVLGTHGVRAEWLLDFAAEAEDVRLRLIACQDYFSKMGAE